MKVTLNNRLKRLPVSSVKLKKIVCFVLDELGCKADEVIIHFVSKKAITDLHAEFFDDPTPTDCITFPYVLNNNSLLGEIFVCPEVAKEYAKKKGLDPQKETILYVIHGLLHLMGYDDLNEKDRKKMRAKERHFMKWLALNF